MAFSSSSLNYLASIVQFPFFSGEEDIHQRHLEPGNKHNPAKPRFFIINFLCRHIFSPPTQVPEPTAQFNSTKYISTE